MLKKTMETYAHKVSNNLCGMHNLHAESIRSASTLVANAESNDIETPKALDVQLRGLRIELRDANFVLVAKRIVASTEVWWPSV